MANQAKPDVNTIWGSAGLAKALSKAKQALGWVAEIPDYDEFNGMLQQISQFQQHVNQEGVALWDALTPYNVGSVVKSPVDHFLYRCLTADLVNTPPVAEPGGAVNANWVKFAFTAAEIQTLIGLYGVTAGQLQTQLVTAFTTAGVAPTFTLTPTPAIAALAANQRFRIKFNAASLAGANTINISGRGAVPLKQYDSTGTKVNAVFASGQLTDAEYDGVDVVLLDILPVDSYGHGECRLNKVGANLVLSPANGNRLMVGGLVRRIPAAGVSLVPSSLVAGTLYYIYAFMSAGVLAIEASTVGHLRDPATGVEVKADDPGRTLVGVARAIAGGAFQDTTAQRFVLSYFNRVDVTSVVPLLGNASTSSATYVELSPTLRCEYLAWANEPVKLIFNGNLTPTAGINSLQYLALADTGATPRDGALICSTVNPGVSIPGTLIDTMSASEGYHYTTIVGKTTAGQTVTLLGAATAPERCVLMTTTRG